VTPRRRAHESSLGRRRGEAHAPTGADDEPDHALFTAAFAAISAPAFVASAAGALLEVNAAGTACLARERGAARDEVRRAVERGASERFSLTRVPRPGGDLWLVVLRDAHLDPAHAAAAAAARWGYTPRQGQILALVCDGLSNRAIAERLGVRERTVETYLTAMFARAQAESRAELVALVSR
jgi:DNA-binding NarL/FixJ family response regulator